MLKPGARSFQEAGIEATGIFATTQWNVVVTAGSTDLPEAADALERLCRAYWFPLYAYVRRQGKTSEDAQDLTQQFFARFLSKNYLAHAKRERGKFRTFLLRSMKHFLVNEWKRAGRLKRGGGQSVISLDLYAAEERYAAEREAEATPEKTYESQWAIALIEQVMGLLRREYDTSGRARIFEPLKIFVWGDGPTVSYAEAAGKLEMTEGAVKVAVHRLRQRFRELLREAVAQTVLLPGDIDDELRHLIAVLS